ncbi:UNVERIFIED_CONTAM: tRNA pseudouridine synthase A [Sesamum latifolium]|uniref:tRNA pseudouridine synthase n=1 Tax=Sesamum latifolium TaxID=2727402 RepID=A0AAW2V102_9LAMI
MTDEQSSPSLPQTSQLSQNQRPEFVERPSKLARIDGGDFSDDGGEEEEEEREFVERNMKCTNPGIQRYLLAIEYIGTRFFGAQKQSTCRTVVGVLEDAFQKFIGQPVSIFCSSRTDAGVHALSNVCHVDVERISKRKPGEVLPPHDPSVVKRAVNHFLQKNEGDIMVIDVRCVPSDFHSRYKAQERTYFYRLLSGKEPLSAFEKDRAWHVPEDLDLLAMQKACQVLVGRHDFSSFRAAGCQAKSPIRTLEELTVTEVASSPYFPSILEREQSNYAKSEIDSPCIPGMHNQCKIENPGDLTIHGFGVRQRHRCFVVTARARSFLYHQVRLLVGVLKSVGTGDLTVSDVERILKAKTISAASPMAPACGLYLGHVKYDLPSDV